MSDTEVKHLILAYFPDIKGSVKVPGYEGWIELESFQWGAGLGIGSASSPVLDADGNPDETKYAERETSSPSVSEVTVSKFSGPESGKLLFNVMTKKGTDIEIVTLLKRTTSNTSESTTPESAPPTSTAESYIRTSAYTLRHTLISGFSRSANLRRDAPASCTTESISLNFGGFESTSFDEAGEPVDHVVYHLHTGTTTYKTWSAMKKGWEIVEVQKKAAEPSDE